MLAPASFIECTDDIQCPILPQPSPSSKLEHDGVYTADEVAELRTSAILLGGIWWSLTYVPIMTWYLWRRPGIRAMRFVNPWYHRAWNTMWMSHYFVF